MQGLDDSRKQYYAKGYNNTKKNTTWFNKIDLVDIIISRDSRVIFTSQQNRKIKGGYIILWPVRTRNVNPFRLLTSSIKECQPVAQLIRRR